MQRISCVTCDYCNVVIHYGQRGGDIHLCDECKDKPSTLHTEGVDDALEKTTATMHDIST